MRSLLKFAEKGFVVLALLIFTGAWIPLLYQIATGRSTASAPEGIVAIQVFFYGIYAITLFLIVLRWKKVFHATTKGKILLVLVGIALASVLWSDAPSVTLRRSSALVGATLFGVYLATRYSLREQLQLLAWALGIAALSSLVFTLAFPTYGIMHGIHEGAWRGVYVQKNSFGRMMSLSALVFLLIAMSSRKYLWLTRAGFGLPVSLVLLSTSKTALIILLTLLVLLPLYRALRWNPSWTVLFFITVVLVGGCVATLVLSNLETVLGALGRDITLTGRTELWAAVLDMIRERPWLGYGYSGFWLGQEGKSAYVSYVTEWNVPHSHNGVLDLWLELGLLGVLVYMLSFLTSCSRAVTWVRWTKTSKGFWPLMFLTFTLLSNITESSILKQNNIFWVLYATVTLSMSVWCIKDGEA